MTYKELKKDLLDKCPGNYFTEKLFEEDGYAYARRSFDDLSKYYSKLGINDKTLLKALYECGFSASICGEIEQIVFFKVKLQYDRFWNNNGIINSGYMPIEDENVKEGCIKPSYLNKLFEEIEQEL